MSFAPQVANAQRAVVDYRAIVGSPAYVQKSYIDAGKLQQDDYAGCDAMPAEGVIGAWIDRDIQYLGDRQPRAEPGNYAVLSTAMSLKQLGPDFIQVPMRQTRKLEGWITRPHPDFSQALVGTSGGRTVPVAIPSHEDPEAPIATIQLARNKVANHSGEMMEDVVSANASTALYLVAAAAAALWVFSSRR